MSVDSPSPWLETPAPDENWLRLKTLFHAGLERPESERASFVAALDARDRHFAEALAALFASHASSGRFLESPPVCAPIPRLGLGDTIDRKYRLDARLGEGGMGLVYRATHLGLGRICALKVIRDAEWSAPSFLDRFRVEAQALGKLHHPNIVTVTDYGVDDDHGGAPYLVMEHLEGTTLARMCADAARLPVDRALALLDGVASGIDYAHRQGILHGDLNPSNIFLCHGSTGPASVRILDFGLARLLAGTPPDGLDDGILGTPACLAPELTSSSDVTAAADIYAFGALAYRILAGRFPFEGSTHEVLAAHRDRAVPLASHVSPSLREVDGPLLRALAKQPEARPASAADVVAELRQAVERADQRLWRLWEAPRRAFISVALALAVGLSALPLWARWPIEQFELQLADVRVATIPQRSPDPRLALIVVDEPTLAADARPLAARADEFGARLSEVFEAGASAVAIDFLLPASWSESRPFSNLVLRHADKLTLAALSSPTADLVVGPECLNPLTTAALGPERASRLFGFVNRETDRDGVHRRARLSYLDEAGSRRSTWAMHAARSFRDGERASDEFWIDHSIDVRRFVRVSWKDLPTALASDRTIFQDRLVLVGGEYLGSGDEQHRIPAQDGEPAGVSGLVLQALLIDTILAGFPVRELSALAPISGLVIVVAALALGTLWLERLPRLLLAFLITAALYAFAALLMFRQTRLLVPMAGPILSASAGLIVAGLIRRALPAIPKRVSEGV